MKDLSIPESISVNDDAVEFVRFWIAGGEDHVVLNIGAMGDREVVQWGMILADISVHIIRGLQQNGSLETADALRSELERAYVGRLKDKDPSYSGQLAGVRH